MRIGDGSGPEIGDCRWSGYAVDNPHEFSEEITSVGAGMEDLVGL